MLSRRHPIILLAIAFAIGPALIELANACGAAIRMAGTRVQWLRWFDPALPFEAPLETFFQSRWPLLMLVTALAMLTPRVRWAVPLAWTYVIAIVSTGIARFLLSGSDLAAVFVGVNPVPLDVQVAYAGDCLTFLLTQVIDLLPAVLLLVAAKSLQRATVREAAPIDVAVAASPAVAMAAPVLAYGHDRHDSNPTRWALRLAFGVACLATVRLIAELAPLAMSFFAPVYRSSGNTLPLYLFMGEAWMVLDSLAEYLLRLGWVLLLIGLWPTRRLVWSRPCVVLGCVAICLWALLETVAVAVSGAGTFIVAGHPAVNVVSCVRVALTELAIPAMILALLRSPLP